MYHHIIAALLIPAVSSGILFAGTLGFGYVYFSFRHKQHLGIFLISLLSLIYILCDSVLILFSAYGTDYGITVLIYRFQQLSIIAFLICLPYFLEHAVHFGSPFRKLNRYLLYGSIIITFTFIMVSILFPKLFFVVSTFTVQNRNSDLFYPVLESSKPGILFYLRDLLLLLMAIYATIITLLDYPRSKRNKYITLIPLGFLTATVYGSTDIIPASSADFFTIFSSPDYSRFSVGLVFFMISSMGFLIHWLFSQAEENRHSKATLEKNKRELLRMAYYDDLTEIANRKSFFLHLNHYLINAISDNSSKTIFFLDLDDFNDINESYGDGLGNLVLKEMVRRIEHFLNVGDRLYRISGDEFAIIWNEVDNNPKAAETARILLKSLSIPVELEENQLYPGVSIGISMIPQHGTSPEQVFTNTHTALKQAKKDKNTYVFYTDEMESQFTQKKHLVQSLRESLRKENFSVVYQPIVNTQGEMTQVEALIRCSNPNMKGISPAVFIPIAEGSGLIIPIHDWLIDQVAKDVMEFQQMGLHLLWNINLSTKLLKNSDRCQGFIRHLSRLGIQQDCIGFEITESAIMENLNDVLKSLECIKSAGFQISIDDFGTGYSSLSYLKRLPVDKLKIDKSFTQGITSNPKDKAVISSILMLAGELELGVVAEGVETPQQWQFLIDRSCDLFQGYLFSRPLAKEDLKEVLIDKKLLI